MNIQQGCELLAMLDESELGALLDRIGGIAAGIREADDLRLGRLGLQQERRRNPRC